MWITCQKEDGSKVTLELIDTYGDNMCTTAYNSAENHLRLLPLELADNGYWTHVSTHGRLVCAID